MKRAAAVCLCVAAVAAAQAVRPTGEYPFQGTVTGTNVYVRSGPGGAGAYPCAKVSQPAKVTVVDRMGDWLKIAPVPGCLSAISKTYVTVDPATKVGTVSGDNVWVRAAGTLRDDNLFTLQVRLNRGATVKVVGEAGDYYKIEPPAGAYFWISGQFVSRGEGGAPLVASGAETSSGVTAAGAAAAGTGTGTGTGTEATTQTSGPAAGGRAAARRLPPGLEAFNAAEKLLAAEYAKPLAQREYGALIAQYKALDVSGDGAYLKPYVEARLDTLKSAIEQQEEMRAVEKLVTSVEEREKKLRLEQAKLDSEAPTTRPVTAYAAQGVLLASDIFPGGPAAPKRYLLRDPKTFLITAYVQCTTGAVDLSQYVGKLVGIKGKAKYDDNLRLDVVEAADVVVLSEKVQLPMPPRPIVGPMPPPPIAPEPAPSPAIAAPPAPPRPAAPKVAAAPPATAVTPPAAPVAPAAAPAVTALPAAPPEPAAKPAPEVRPEFGPPPPAPKTEPIVIAPPAPAPAPKPVAEPVLKPIVEPAAVPAVEPAPKPIVIPPIRPTVEPTPQPAAVPVAVPVVKPTVEPVVKPIAEPVVKPLPAPTTQPVVVSLPAPATRPAAATPKPTTRPAGKPVIEKEFD